MAAASNPPYSNTRWWGESTTAVVTGANKGIGYFIASELAKNGVNTVMTSRDMSMGEAARAKIESEASAAGSKARVLCHQLDIANGASIDSFAAWLKDNVGGIDILVNNAGFAFKGNTFGADEAQRTLETNYYGTANVCGALEPLMRNNGRIVNVSSMAGYTKIIPDDKLRAQWLQASSKAELDALSAKFVADIKAGQHQQQGWPNSMYGVSKLACSMYTRVLSEELKGRNIMVNACCPGWCSTDMSSHRGPKPALAGADTPTWLALRPPTDFVTGTMFTERHEVPW